MLNNTTQDDEDRKKLPVLTKEQFRDKIANHGKQLVAYDGLVCDINGFQHPGGDFLHHFVGTDITENIIIAHKSDAKVINMLGRRAVAKLNHRDDLIAEEDADFRRLRETLENEGALLQQEQGKLWYPLLEAIFICIIGLAALHFECRVTGTVILTVVHIRLSWWLHDAAHHAFFADGQKMSTIVDVLALVVFGIFGSNKSFRDHTVHHVFINCTGIDWTFLQMFALDPSAKAHKSSWELFLQFPLFLVIPALHFPREYYLSLQRIFFGKRIDAVGALMFGLRHFTFLYFFGLRAYLPVILASYFVAFVSCLNHISMEMFNDGPMDPRRPKSYLRRQIQTTLSIRSGWLWSWLAGGLDSHAEHHLFPDLDHSMLPKVRKEVTELAAKHNIPYHVVPVMTAIQLLHARFSDPSFVPDQALTDIKNHGTTLERLQKSFDVCMLSKLGVDTLFLYFCVSTFIHLHARMIDGAGGCMWWVLVPVTAIGFLIGKQIKRGIHLTLFSELVSSEQLDEEGPLTGLFFRF